MTATLLQYPFMSRNGLDAATTQALADAMLTFELALAELQEKYGARPKGASRRMTEAFEHHVFDLETIAAGVASGGNAAIPFVKRGRGVLPHELKRYWHQSATSHDVLDSALMLLLKPRLAAIDTLLSRCRTAAVVLMRAHDETPMVGRTLMQQALPITFGVKIAHWALSLEQARRRLAPLIEQGLPV